MMKYILTLAICFALSQYAHCNDTLTSYKNFYEAQKQFGYDNLTKALDEINKFQQTKAFDIYAARLKLKILYKLKSNRLLDEFFTMVKETGIKIEDLQYNALKNKEDSIYFLSKHTADEFENKYFKARQEYLCQLTDPEYAIEIDKILTQDQSARILPQVINTWEDSLNKYIYNKQLGFVDSLNFIELKELITKNGLPTVEKIGYAQYNLVFMAAMHISVTKSIPQAFQFFDSVFVKTVSIGQMNPEFYMFFRDAVNRKNLDCQIYGYLQYKHPTYGRSLFTFCDDSETEINKKRKAIGAGKISDACRFERVYCNYKSK